MSENKELVFSDFEVVMDTNESSLLNETQLPEQNETGNMEQDSSIDMSADSVKPVAKPRNHIQKVKEGKADLPNVNLKNADFENGDVKNAKAAMENADLENADLATNLRDDMHLKREVAWTNEKEKLLGKIQELEEKLQEKDRRNEDKEIEYKNTIQGLEKELADSNQQNDVGNGRIDELEVQMQNDLAKELAWTKEKEKLLGKIQELEEKLREKDRRNEENLTTLKNKKGKLQNKCEELLRRNTEELDEKEKACEEIKELKWSRQECQVRVQELESQVENLQKCLDEQTECCNKSLAKITGFENKEIEYKNTIQGLEKELADSNQQNDVGNGRIDELEVQMQNDLAKELAWTKEKEKLLGKIQELEEKLREKDRRNEENLTTLENKKGKLQNKCEELLRRNTEELDEKEKACEEIKELKWSRQECQVRVQELESQVENLQKCLDEQTESCNKSLAKITGFENKEIEYKNTIQGLEKELADSSQQNDVGNGRIDELEEIKVQMQSDLGKERESLERQNEDLEKIKELYTELLSINNDMEKEQHEHKTSIRELTAELQKKDIENEKFLREKNEMMRQVQQANADFKKQMDKVNKNAHEIQDQRDELEDKLIAIRLEQKRLNNENTTSASELHEMKNKAATLREERDFYVEKCKELEKGTKLNANNEITQLTKSLESLNEENEILRKRNKKYEKDLGLLNNKIRELESKLGQLSGKEGKLVDSSDTARSVSSPGSYSAPTPHCRTSFTIPVSSPGSYAAPTSSPGSHTVPPDTEPTTQKQSGAKFMDTTTTESYSQQWYESEEGEELYREIFEKLKNKFSADPVKISKALRTQDLSLFLATERHEKFEVLFPRNFPRVACTVNHRGKSEEIKVLFNRNALSEFAADVTKCVYQACIRPLI